jgi:hypothetical protein
VLWNVERVVSGVRTRVYAPAVPSGEVVIGVTAVITSGVLGPLVLHHAQKDRDSLGDQRTALDLAVEPIAKARAQTAWLENYAFDPKVSKAEVDRRLEETLHQMHLVDAFAVKLTLRFPGSELALASVVSRK